MQTDEALKILNIEKPDLTSVLIETKYKKFFELNDPKKGGSFYLQSKIYRAKEALLEDIRVEPEGKSDSDKKVSDSYTPGSSTSNETKSRKK
jgi:mitochondrial import inner membrane translocase subunit TIM16